MKTNLLILPCENNKYSKATKIGYSPEVVKGKPLKPFIRKATNKDIIRRVIESRQEGMLIKEEILVYRKSREKK